MLEVRNKNETPMDYFLQRIVLAGVSLCSYTLTFAIHFYDDIFHPP